jgi:ATP-dependent Lon protease
MDDYNTTGNFKNLIIQDIERNFSIYNNLLKHLYNLYKNNIISEKIYFDNIDKLDDINTEIDISKSRLLLENNSIDYLIKVQNDVQNIFKEFLQIINNYGFNSSNKILEYYIPYDYYDAYHREIKRKFSFLNDFFVIIKVNKKTITGFSNIKLKISLNKEMKMPIDNNTNIFLANKNMLFELNKAVCELEIDDILITLEGYFIEDPLNDIYKEQLFIDKYCNLVNSIQLVEIPSKFKLRYINQLNIRDFLIKSNEVILTDLENTYFDTKTLENKMLSELLKSFIFRDSYEQRKMIINLLLSNDNYLLASALVDSLNNGLGLIFKNSDQIKNTIHYSLRKRLSLASTELEEKKGKLNPEIKIDYNTKLALLNISDKIKGKVFEKIKELTGNKESSSKAENYIDGFFKIPFNIFIKEDIFVKCENSYNKINKLKNDINDNLNNKNEIIKNPFDISNLNLFLVNNVNDSLNLKINNLLNEVKLINIEKKKYLNFVRNTLDDAIYGQQDSKREVERIIAQWMNGNMDGCVLGFHGPPGVGKTCFAKKGISKCLVDKDGNYRPFCFLQLGGASDGHILEGHNYTYLGSKCGRLIEFLMESKCMNPIIYFDELDKISQSEKGKEITNILIHLIDKSQNKEIYDRFYSGIELDFSKCIFIFSYNDASKVDRILRDRITEIKISSLKLKEKIVVTQKYTLKDLSNELNFECELNEDLVEYIIENYTHEAGVRKLNEKLTELFREINLRYIEKQETIIITTELIDEILNRHYKFKQDKIHSEPAVGMINGLYATTDGLGGLIVIQVQKTLSSNPKIELELTGQQGDVMKESMLCAKTLAINLLNDDEKNKFYDEMKNKPFGLHIHCPDTATPKDGPSAGIAITTAIYSTLTKKLIKNDYAMTGEVDLMGNAKAIGGLEYKILGAIKAGVKHIIVPEENRQDYDKIIQKNNFVITAQIYFVHTIKDVLEKIIIDFN